MKKVLIIGLMAFAWWSPAQYRFSHLTSNDGLSQNSVTDLFQDSRGFVWIATQDGLNRYDGHDFVQYNTGGIQPLPDNFIWDITEDQHGNIWVASRKGAIRLNWRSNKVTSFQITKSNTSGTSINQVAGLSISNDHLLISFYQKTYELHPSIYPDSSSVILTNTTLKQWPEDPSNFELHHAFRAVNKEWRLYHDHLEIEGKSIPFPGDHLITFENSGFLSLDDGFLVSTRMGVLRFHFESLEFHELSCIQAYATDLIAVDKEIWVGTSDGILLLDRRTFNCKGWIKPGEGEADLTVSAITALMQTREGLVWVGTSNGGIHIYDPRKEQFKFLKKEHGIGRPPIWSVLQEGSHIWLGTEEGLYRITLKNDITDGYFGMEAASSIEKINLPSLQNTRVTTIETIDSQTLLVGTSKGNLMAVDKGSLTGRSVWFPTEVHPGSFNVITSIQKSKTYVWVASYFGLYQFDLDLKFIQKMHFDQFASAGLVNEYFLSAHVADDRLWLGSNIGVFSRSPSGTTDYFPYKEDKREDSPAFNFVSGFQKDEMGRMWIATYGGGVSVLDIATKKFFHLTTANGLPNNVCSSIIGQGQFIWVSTNEGISRINVKSLAIRNFTKKDGLISNEFAITAVTKTPSGELLFGGVDGLLALLPDRIMERDAPTAPIISSILVNYQEIPATRFETELRLSPDDRSITIHFSSLDYRFNTDYRYEYLLDGFDQKWVRTTAANRQATYTPPPGAYTFRVRAVHDGLYSEAVALSIRVFPPFYQTVWFIATSIMLLLGSTVFIVRYYSQRKLQARLRELETQQKIQKERERISRDLHDNVGSHLTYIASSLDNLSDTAKANELGEFARETMNQLRESIWAINQDTVALPDLKLKILGFLVHVLQHHEGTKHFVEIEESSQTINPNTAIHIFRIIQEAVNNALKHAKATEIHIQLTVSETPILTITDNGCGFDGNDKEGHFGLANLRNRAAEIGAECKLETTPGKGTRITISGFEIGQMT